MHLKRWITGLTAVPFLVYIIVKGGVVFSVFIAVVAVLGLWEYCRVVFSHSRETVKWPGLVVSFLALLMIMWAAYRHDMQLMLHSLMLHLILTACVSVIYFQRDRFIFESAKKQIMGVLYVPLLLSYLILIRGGEHGAVWIFFVLSVVFGGDIGALYVGTFFGRHPLHPAVSPQKTIEGSLGGIAANLVLGSAFKLIFLNELSWPVSLLFFIALGIAGQAGDLFESGLKRIANVKDSGGILPGHGGILDRADAVMFAAPVAYLFKVYFF